jgi:DNA-binding transcriptional regulator YiaG
MSTKKVDSGQKNLYVPVPMSPEQVRAARNWLAWTQAELAERANVGLSTVKDYESAKRTPIANNLEAIKKALQSGGIVFTTKSVSGPIKSVESW